MSTPKEHPILFSGPMVRAILAGNKTQTRRVVTTTKRNATEFFVVEGRGVFNGFEESLCDECGVEHEIHCPYGAPGDHLYVREKWQHFGNMFQGDATLALVKYAADGQTVEHHVSNPPKRKWWNTGRTPFAPSIHMPRWASRITLEVTGVRVERLQEIGEVDAKAEGALWWHGKQSEQDLARDHFRQLWDSINAKRGYGWKTNCWVWVVEFRKL